MELKEFCLVCGKDREYHLSDTVKHQFSLEGQLRAKPAMVDHIEPVGLPKGDPILRLLLIRLGVVTVDQLENLEKELRASGVASVGTVARSSGENTADSGG